MKTLEQLKQEEIKRLQKIIDSKIVFTQVADLKWNDDLNSNNGSK